MQLCEYNDSYLVWSRWSYKVRHNRPYVSYFAAGDGMLTSWTPAYDLSAVLFVSTANRSICLQALISARSIVVIQNRNARLHTCDTEWIPNIFKLKSRSQLWLDLIPSGLSNVYEHSKRLVWTIVFHRVASKLNHRLIHFVYMVAS